MSIYPVHYYTDNRLSQNCKKACELVLFKLALLLLFILHFSGGFPFASHVNSSNYNLNVNQLYRSAIALSSGATLTLIYCDCVCALCNRPVSILPPASIVSH